MRRRSSQTQINHFAKESKWFKVRKGIMGRSTALLIMMAMACIAILSCNPTDDDSQNMAFEIVETDNGKTFSSRNR